MKLFISKFLIILTTSCCFGQKESRIELNSGLAFSNLLPSYSYQKESVFPVLNVNALYHKRLTKRLSVFLGIRFQPQQAKYRLLIRNEESIFKPAIHNLRLSYLSLPIGGELSFDVNKNKTLSCSINGGLYFSYLLDRNWIIKFEEEPLTYEQRGKIESDFNYGYLFGISMQYSVNQKTKITLRGEYNKSIPELKVMSTYLSVYQHPMSIPITVGISKEINKKNKK